MAPQLAWIGLGNMGRGMCKNLVEKGDLSHPLILYNRSRQRADDLSAALGASKTSVAPTIAEAAERADIIFVCISDDAADRQIADEIAAVKPSGSSGQGKLVVDCSTVHPDTTAALDSTLQKAGHRLVAMPVFGSQNVADAGQLVCAAAGRAADIAAVKPYCDGVMGRATIAFPDAPPQKAALLKVIGNSMILQMNESLGEATTLADKTGLGPEKLHEFVELIFGGFYAQYAKRMREGTYYKKDPFFGVDLAIKDSGHALKLAEENGVKLGAVEVGRRHLQDVKAYHGAKGDLAGVYGAVRMEAGLPYENGEGDEGKAKAK